MTDTVYMIIVIISLIIIAIVAVVFIKLKNSYTQQKLDYFRACLTKDDIVIFKTFHDVPLPVKIINDVHNDGRFYAIIDIRENYMLLNASEQTIIMYHTIQVPLYVASELIYPFNPKLFTKIPQD